MRGLKLYMDLRFLLNPWSLSTFHPFYKTRYLTNLEVTISPELLDQEAPQFSPSHLPSAKSLACYPALFSVGSGIQTLVLMLV